MRDNHGGREENQNRVSEALEEVLFDHFGLKKERGEKE